MSSPLRVNVVCRNYRDDRVLPRFARYLGERLAWMVTAAPAPPASVDVYYLMGYFESQLFASWPTEVRTASLFTHLEEEPPNNAKARLYMDIAQRVDLRVAMCRLYGEALERVGPIIQPHLPVERERFVIAPAPRTTRPIVGLSGFTYHNARKGEDLLQAVLRSKVGRRVEWTASGRGWPVPMRRLTWAEMPRFYQGLHVLVCPSRVEGGPMTVLEALSCGVSVVVPRGVGILDELPDTPGIYRYSKGDPAGLVSALEHAAFPEASVDRERLRAVTASHTVDAWCRDHAVGFAQAFREGTSV